MLNWHVHFVGRGGIASFAIAALDIALWDLRAKSQRLPLWKLLAAINRKFGPMRDLST